MTDKDDQTQPVADENADVDVTGEATAAAPADDQPTDQPQAAPADDSAGGQAASRDQYGRQMYTVKCSSCGKDAQVPFQPSGDRPVYCRDCYMQQRQQRTGGPRR